MVRNMINNNKRDKFILQAGILAIAGILCRIIGILYRSPLTSIIGDEGNGYYSSAYNIYTIILLISSYSIPSAISKIIAGRLALKEYRNAHKIFICSLIYVIVVGGAASLFAFFGAGYLVDEHSVIVLRVFAPTIFLSGLLGVLRGYFQAHKTMLQTSFSQIIEQIMNAVVSILAAYLLMQTVSHADATTQAIYGAMGSAMGTGMGVVIALIFMWSVYGLNRKLIHKRIRHDVTENELSYSSIYKIIFFMVTPVILSTFIYNFSTSLNYTLYSKILKNVGGYSSSDIATVYGIFAGKAVVIANIPIAIAAMSAAIIPTVATTHANGDYVGTNKKISEAIQTTMLIAIPSAIGLTVLAEPIVALLFPQKESLALAANLLRGLSVTVVFFSLSTLTNAFLQGVGKVNLPVINAAISLVVQTIVLVVLLLFTDLNLYALVIAMIVYSLLMCILNGISVKRCLGYREIIIKTFVLPLLSACIMGLVAFFVYEGVYVVIKRNTISLIFSILVAVVVYFVAVIKTGTLTREELCHLPKGGKIVRVAEKLHLL